MSEKISWNVLDDLWGLTVCRRKCERKNVLRSGENAYQYKYVHLTEILRKSIYLSIVSKLSYRTCTYSSSVHPNGEHREGANSYYGTWHYGTWPLPAVRSNLKNNLIFFFINECRYVARLHNSFFIFIFHVLGCSLSPLLKENASVFKNSILYFLKYIFTLKIFHFASHIKLAYSFFFLVYYSSFQLWCFPCYVLLFTQQIKAHVSGFLFVITRYLFSLWWK